MTWICDNCHTEWYDGDQPDEIVHHHQTDCASCTNGYDMQDEEDDEE